MIGNLKRVLFEPILYYDLSLRCINSGAFVVHLGRWGIEKYIITIARVFLPCDIIALINFFQFFFHLNILSKKKVEREEEKCNYRF